MVKGFHLTLMIGPGFATPVSKDVLDALTSVTVTTNSDSGSGFQLEFTLSNRSPLQTLFLLSGGASIPLVRVIIIMTVNGAPEVLMDGVMTNHEIQPGADASHSTLTVTGEDLSRVMDYVDFSGVPHIGHGFADELFRVFAGQQAGFELVPVNMSPAVASMVASVRS